MSNFYATWIALYIPEQLTYLLSFFQDLLLLLQTSNLLIRQAPKQILTIPQGALHIVSDFNGSFSLEVRSSLAALGIPLSGSNRSIHKHCHSFQANKAWNIEYKFLFFFLSGSLFLPGPCKRTSRVLGSCQHMLRSKVQENGRFIMFTVVLCYLYYFFM